MCLVLFAVGAHPDYPLVVAANRDEFYRRPALPVHHWDEDPRVVAGRDLEADGTWLGISAVGRFAAVTNYSDPVDSAPLSRGALTATFLTGEMSAENYAASIHGASYRGFNLLLWDGEHMVYVSNKAPMQRLRPGTYGLSNAALGSEWPKVIRGRSVLQSVLRQQPSSRQLIKLLADDTDLDFVGPDGAPRMWTVLLGDNGLCKSTILQCAAISAAGSKLGSALARDASVLQRVGETEDAIVHAKFAPSSEEGWGGELDARATLWSANIRQTAAYANCDTYAQNALGGGRGALLATRDTGNVEYFAQHLPPPGTPNGPPVDLPPGGPTCASHGHGNGGHQNGDGHDNRDGGPGRSGRRC
mgnify:CR=1 FL=1